MPAVTLLGHNCTGHGCWPPRPSVAGAPGMVINGRRVVTVGDSYAPHTCPSIPETHGGVLADGAPGLTINGRRVGRIGDPLSCGSRVAQGVAGVLVEAAQ